MLITSLAADNPVTAVPCNTIMYIQEKVANIRNLLYTPLVDGVERSYVASFMAFNLSSTDRPQVVVGGLIVCLKKTGKLLSCAAAFPITSTIFTASSWAIFTAFSCSLFEVA